MGCTELSDAEYMRRAIELAHRAQALGEVPVGALVTLGGQIVGEGWNNPISSNDPTAHAEIVALRAAGTATRNYRLTAATLYVTLEPCIMCVGAMLHARLGRVVFGAWDPKAGACGSVLDLPREPRLGHRLDAFGGVCSDDCGRLLRAFFCARRGAPTRDAN